MIQLSHPIKSTTVILLRDGTDGMEVFMVTRNAGIDFAGGALVYPGGKTNPEDLTPETAAYCDGNDDLDISEIGSRVCGIRETFEEAGFLLAREKNTGMLINRERCLSIGAAYREPIRRGKASMKDLASNEHLTLACDLLVPFAHWITPSISPKRYDTWFYLTKAPEGQLGSHDNSETVASLWINPDQALAGAENKIYNIVFATRMNLRKLGKSDNLKLAMNLAQANKVITVEPEVINENNNITFRIPQEAGYDMEQETETVGPAVAFYASG